MALVKIKPYIVDATGNYTFNGVNATGNLSSLNANLGNAAVANYFIGSGANLTNIPAANISGQVANALISGTVYTNAQPNITSVGTLTSFTSTGTVNLTGASNVSLGPVGNVKITGGSSGQYLQTDGSGTLTWATVTSGSTSTISNGNSNVNIPAANGNVNISAVGNANVLIVTGTGVNVSGTLNTGSGIITGNGSGLSSIAGANVTGAVAYATTANSVAAANITGTVTAGTAGTVTTAAQPNITSVGTLTSLDVTGNVAVGAASYGAIAVANTTGFSTTWSTAQQAAAWTISFWIYIPTQSINYPRGLFYNGDASTGQAVQVFLGWNGASTYSLQLENRYSGSGSNFTKTLSGAVSQNAWHFITVSYNGTNTVYLGLDGDVSAVTGSAISSIWSGLAFGKGTGATGQFNTYGPQTYTDVELTLGTTNYTSNFTPPTTHPTTAGKTLLLLAKTAGTYITNEVTGTNVSINGSPTFDSSNPIAPTGSLTVAVSANLGNSATANYFIGSGNNLSNIQGANVTGAVGLATYATTANSVAGANVTGAVAYATTANSVAGANVSGAVAYATTANSVAGANVSGQVSNALVAGTVYTAAQPNITSVGTLTDLSVSGNAVVNGNLTVSGALEYTNVNNLYIKDPIIELGGGTNAAPLTTNDGKDRGTLLHYYNTAPVDAFMGWDTGNAEFTFGSNVSVASEVVTYNTLGNVRVGNLIGAVANGNSNVNIPAANGNINLTAAGSTTVVVTGTGANISGTANVTGNLSAGNINAGNLLTTNNLSVTTFVTSSLIPNANITYNLGNSTNRWKDLWLSNSTLYFDTTSTMAAGTITNGTSNISVPVANGNVLISSAGNANILIVTGTGANVTGTANVTGNLSAANANLGNSATANFFIGAGNNLSNIQGSNVTGQVGNALLAGTVYTNAQPNITSIGSLTGLTVSNATGVVNFSNTANVSLGAVANLKITGGTADYVLKTDGAGNLSWTAQTGGGGGGASISNGTSNVNIATSGGNVTTSVAGNANIVVVTGTGANINGTLNTTGNVAFSGANVSLGAVANLKITGGTADYVLKTDGAGNLSWTAQTGGGGSSISNGTSNVNIATSGGDVTISAGGTPNELTITSTGVNVAGYANIVGNLSVTGANVSLGDISNIKIAGGTNGYVIKTDGTGNLSWTAQTGGGGGGGVSSIQEFVATAAQTTFTVSGGYTVGSTLVFVNGIGMNNGDYTASSGTNVVLAEARNAGDIVRVVYNLATPSLIVSDAKNFAVAMSIALGM